MYQGLLVVAPAVSGMEASGGSPDGARVFHYGTDEMLLQHDSIPEQQTTPPTLDIWKSNQYGLVF